ncbi:hypothetical protein HPB52_005387 [Rhipicephalus sanguineus]|uniref:Tick transposon n=1 Tax=Rhipicephalus sanguineus TaxID=34632 RepID=A0A9D4QHE2_RHISA|nr:hypothetical protein HPB52_005387 [Rhipicephalus sanguineus]
MELRPPEPLQLTGNLASNWKSFKQKFDLFLQATASKEHPRTESSKAALLLSVAGDDALDAFNTFQFADEESREDYGTVVRKFEAYYSEGPTTCSGATDVTYFAQVRTIVLSQVTKNIARLLVQLRLPAEHLQSCQPPVVRQPPVALQTCHSRPACYLVMSSLQSSRLKSQQCQLQQRMPAHRIQLREARYSEDFTNDVIVTSRIANTGDVMVTSL